MKRLKIFGLLVTLALLAFGLALSCDNGTTSNVEQPEQPIVYRYEDEANDILILFSSEPFAARATSTGAEDGDYYEIRRLSDETVLLSSGQIAKVGKAITFKQEGGEVEFTGWEDTDGGLSIAGIPDPANPGQTLPPVVTGPPSVGPGPGPTPPVTQPVEPEEPDPEVTIITFTVASDVTDNVTTGLVITFSDELPVLLTHEQVTITGNAARDDTKLLSKSGNAWTVPIKNPTNGFVKVSIAYSFTAPNGDITMVEETEKTVGVQSTAQTYYIDATVTPTDAGEDPDAAKYYVEDTVSIVLTASSTGTAVGFKPSTELRVNPLPGPSGKLAAFTWDDPLPTTDIEIATSGTREFSITVLEQGPVEIWIQKAGIKPQVTTIYLTKDEPITYNVTTSGTDKGFTNELTFTFSADPMDLFALKDDSNRDLKADDIKYSTVLTSASGALPELEEGVNATLERINSKTYVLTILEEYYNEIDAGQVILYIDVAGIEHASAPTAVSNGKSVQVVRPPLATYTLTPVNIGGVTRALTLLFTRDVLLDDPLDDETEFDVYIGTATTPDASIVVTDVIPDPKNKRKYTLVLAEELTTASVNAYIRYKGAEKDISKAKSAAVALTYTPVAFTAVLDGVIDQDGSYDARIILTFAAPLVDYDGELLPALESDGEDDFVLTQPATASAPSSITVERQSSTVYVMTLVGIDDTKPGDYKLKTKTVALATSSTVYYILNTTDKTITINQAAFDNAVPPPTVTAPAPKPTIQAQTTGTDGIFNNNTLYSRKNTDTGLKLTAEAPNGVTGVAQPWKWYYSLSTGTPGANNFGTELDGSAGLSGAADYATATLDLSAVTSLVGSSATAALAAKGYIFAAYEEDVTGDIYYSALIPIKVVGVTVTGTSEYPVIGGVVTVADSGATEAIVLTAAVDATSFTLASSTPYAWKVAADASTYGLSDPAADATVGGINDVASSNAAALTVPVTSTAVTAAATGTSKFVYCVVTSSLGFTVNSPIIQIEVE